MGTENDAQIVAAVREATDRPLRVDANEGWRDKEQALEKIQWLQKMGVELIEQPLPAAMIDETAWLRERVDIPIIADEAVKRAGDIPKLAGAYDGINIKLMKAGGIQEAIRMIHVARALGLKIMLGCMIESSVAIAAAAHDQPPGGLRRPGRESADLERSVHRSGREERQADPQRSAGPGSQRASRKLMVDRLSLVRSAHAAGSRPVIPMGMTQSHATMPEPASASGLEGAVSSSCRGAWRDRRGPGSL